MAMILVSGAMFSIWRSSSSAGTAYAGLLSAAQVEQHDVGLQAANQRERLFGSLTERDVQVGKDRFELTPQSTVVFQNQQFAPFLIARAHGSPLVSFKQARLVIISPGTRPTHIGRANRRAPAERRYQLLT